MPSLLLIVITYIVSVVCVIHETSEPRKPKKEAPTQTPTPERRLQLAGGQASEPRPQSGILTAERLQLCLEIARVREAMETPRKPVLSCGRVGGNRP